MKKPSIPQRWRMQDAKARLSHVVKEAREKGPQILTVHGEEVAVIQSISDFNKARRQRGPSLIEALLDIPRVKGFKVPQRDKNDVVGNEPPLFK